MTVMSLQCVPSVTPAYTSSSLAIELIEGSACAMLLLLLSNLLDVCRTRFWVLVFGISYVSDWTELMLRLEMYLAPQDWLCSETLTHWKWSLCYSSCWNSVLWRSWHLQQEEHELSRWNRELSELGWSGIWESWKCCCIRMFCFPWTVAQRHSLLACISNSIVKKKKKWQQYKCSCSLSWFSLVWS